MAKANGGKHAEKPTGKPTAPHLIEQPNGGALMSGGTPGNKSNTGRHVGRPRSALRNLFFDDLETARGKMMAILERETEECEECGGVQTAMDRDIVAIFDKLAKYSIGERKEIVAVDTELMNELGAVVGRHVEDDQALESIREEWLAILASRLGS